MCPVDGDEADKSRQNKNDRQKQPAQLLKKHTKMAVEGLAVKPSKSGTKTIKVKSGKY